MPRVLYVGGWSSPQNLETDSTLSWVRGFLLPWVRETPDVFMFMTVPGGEYRAQSDKALKPFMAEPRIQLVYTVGDSKKQYREMTAYQPELAKFDELYGDYPWIDLVVTDRPAALPMMRAQTESYTVRGGWGRVYAAVSQFLMDEKSAQSIHKAIRRAQAYGLAEADLTLWGGENHRDRALIETAQWLSSERQAKLRAGARTYMGGLNLSGVQQFVRPLEERAKDPILVWGTAIAVAYKPREILGEYDTLYSTGHPVRVRVITSTHQSEVGTRVRDVLPERVIDWVEWYAALPQQNFWKLASDGAAFVAGALTAEFGYAWAELAVLGLIGIYEDKAELRAQVVPGYPYWWKSKNDLRTWLRHLIVEGAWQDEEAQGWVTKQRDYLIDNFTGAANWPRFDKDVRFLIDQRGTPKEAVDELIRECTADAGDEMTLAQFSRRLKAWSKFGRGLEQAGGGRYALSRTIYRGVLMRQGWTDVCDAEEPRFVRTGR